MLPDNNIKVTGAGVHCQHSFIVVMVNSYINTTCFNQLCYSSGHLLAYNCIKICATETEILNLTVQEVAHKFYMLSNKLLHQFIKDSHDT
jgi:hypothetical protein